MWKSPERHNGSSSAGPLGMILYLLSFLTPVLSLPDQFDERKDTEGDEGSPCCSPWYVSLFLCSLFPLSSLSSSLSSHSSLSSLLSFLIFVLAQLVQNDEFTSKVIAPKCKKPCKGITSSSPPLFLLLLLFSLLKKDKED